MLAACTAALAACGGGTKAATVVVLSTNAPVSAKSVPLQSLTGQTSSAAVWTNALCVGLLPILKDEKSVTSVVSASASDDPSAIRNQFLTALSTVQVDFQTAHDLMLAAGQPDVTNGDQIELGILTAFQTGADSFGEAAVTLKNATAADPAAVGQALSSAETTLNTGGSAALDAVGKAGSLDTSGAINAAGSADPDCAALQTTAT